MVHVSNKHKFRLWTHTIYMAVLQNIVAHDNSIPWRENSTQPKPTHITFLCEFEFCGYKLSPFPSK